MVSRGKLGRAVAGMALVVTGLGLRATAPEPAAAADPPDCTVTATLVNPCRPWLGVVAGNYPGPGGVRAQYEAHEARIGKRVDVVHTYKDVGNVTLSSDERYFANRGTILYVNWKPAAKWAQATGGNATVNAQIDTLANQIKALGNHRVMLSIHGEPERVTSKGSSACPGLKGDTGTPAEYRAMWANVQNRFAARGTTNVVWVMNYLGYVGWDCLFKELWPGNDRVDWITWDPYLQTGMRWDTEIGYFYRALEAKTDAAHAFTSKPWGLAEYGSWRNAPQSDAYRMYDDAKASLEGGRFPRLKMYEIYDTINAGGDIRVGYDGLGVADPVEQQRYNAFAHSPAFTNPTTPPDPPDPPAVTDHLSSCDVGVETAISCFRGIYRAPVRPTRTTAAAHQGAASVEVRNTTTAAGAFGLNLDPRPVSSTQVGRVYTARVYVRPEVAGTPITVLLREARPDGTAPANGYTAVTVTPPTTGWTAVTAAYTAKQSGNTLSFSVYATLPATRWFRADTFSLTSVAPG
ncbi:MAG TPA: hypothetical protein VF228_17490 [Iamia sp.]